MKLRLVSAVAALPLLATLATASEPSASPSPLSVVLTVTTGSDLNPTNAGVAFANAVRSLSKGQMTIVFRPTPGGLTVQSERLAIQEVREGSVPMAWIPTRGWDTQGLRTFTALQAPFLITDYPLLRKVLTGAIGRGMLVGTRNLGVRTLGLAPSDLRRMLGARKPFAAPADFRDTKIRVPASSAVTS